VLLQARVPGKAGRGDGREEGRRLHRLNGRRRQSHCGS
jgi:hypothetical protein